MHLGPLPRIVTALLALLLATMLVSCSAGSTGVQQAPVPQEDRAGDPAEGEAAAEGGAAQQAPQEDVDRLVIRTQTMRFKVASTSESIDAVREIAGQHSAIVANMWMASDNAWIYDSPSGTSTVLRGWVTVRVPAEDVDAFVAAVSELGELVYQEETSDDVTQEHVDLSARLENLRAQEQRLRELAAQAADVQETLSVEREMWRVRGEIESLDAQIKYLERQAAMATVTIEFTEDGPVVARDSGLRAAFRNGVRAAAEMLAFVITFVIATSPLWLLGLGIFFAVRAIRRRRRLTAGQPEPKPGGRRRGKAAVQPTPDPAADEPAASTPAADATEASTPASDESKEQ